MAKQKLRLTLAGNTIAAPVWPRDEISWEANKVGCPYCSRIRKVRAICDVLQYGLIDYDLCITVLECRACKKRFGVKYAIDHISDSRNESEE